MTQNAQTPDLTITPFLGRRITLAYTLDGEIIPHEDVFKHMLQHRAGHLKNKPSPEASNTATLKAGDIEWLHKKPSFFWRSAYIIWTLAYTVWMLFIGVSYWGYSNADNTGTTMTIFFAILASIPTLMHLYFMYKRKFPRT